MPGRQDITPSPFKVSSSAGKSMRPLTRVCLTKATRARSTAQLSRQYDSLRSHEPYGGFERSSSRWIPLSIRMSGHGRASTVVPAQLCSLLMMTGLGHAEAQTTTTRFASTFDEVFSNQGKVTPVFTRPEAPPPPTSIEGGVPPNTEHQNAAGVVEPEGPASASGDRVISPADTTSSPPHLQGKTLRLSHNRQAMEAAPRQTASPGKLLAGRRIASGRATWYAQSGRTASGEMFDPNRLTAAHRTLPFGTRLRIVNQAEWPVGSRAHQRPGRSTRTSVLNLSRGSARAIGITGTGLVALHRLD